MQNNSNITVLNNQEVLGQNFTVYGDLDNPLFLAKDVAEMIGHSKVSMMLEGIDDDEKLKEVIFTSGQAREMWFLTEYGLYEVLMQSRKPIAKEFKKEIKAILKDLRRTGVVITANAKQEDIDFNSVFGRYRIRKSVRESNNRRQLFEQFIELSAKERTASRMSNKDRINSLDIFADEIENIIASEAINMRTSELVALQELLTDISKEKNRLSNKANGGVKSNMRREIRQLKEENQLLKNQQDLEEFKDLSDFHMIPRHSFTANKLIEVKNGRIVNSNSYKAWMDNLRLSDFLPADMEDVDFTGKLKLYLGFVSIPSMDLDNQVKAIQDALSKHYSFNDNQIGDLVIKRLDTVDTYKEGKIYIKITNIDDIFDVEEDDNER